jgi:ketosteroid isomerase-like protein
MKEKVILTVNGFLDAVRRKSPERLADLYSEDAVYEGPGAGRLARRMGNRLSGRADVLAFWREAFKTYAGTPSWNVTSMLIQPPQVLLEYEDQRQKFCDVFEIHGGAITSHRSYWGSLPPRWLWDELKRAG